MFSLIAAADSKMGIGKNGKLPWHLPSDLKYFNEMTVGKGNNVVIMGRLTWESIPEKNRPLSKRKNIVITRDTKHQVPHDVEKAQSLEEALAKAAQKNPDSIFIIGGSQIFHDAILHPACTDIYLTHVDGDFQCDVFFPKIDEGKLKKIVESVPQKEHGIEFRFVHYKKA